MQYTNKPRLIVTEGNKKNIIGGRRLYCTISMEALKGDEGRLTRELRD